MQHKKNLMTRETNTLPVLVSNTLHSKQDVHFFHMKKIMPRAVLSVDRAVCTVNTRMYNNLLDDDSIQQMRGKPCT